MTILVIVIIFSYRLPVQVTGRPSELYNFTYIAIQSIVHAYVSNSVKQLN